MLWLGRTRLDRPILLVLCGITCSRMTRMMSVYGSPTSHVGFVMATNPLSRREARPPVTVCTKPSAGDTKSIFAFFRRAIPFSHSLHVGWWKCMSPSSWRLFSSNENKLQLKTITGSAPGGGIVKSRNTKKPTALKNINAVMNSQSGLDAGRVLNEISGIFAVDKPSNWTSFDVVGKIRSTLSKRVHSDNPELSSKQCRVKVGHGGTLDPDATGVLVIGVGKGTKSMDLYTKGSKCYEAIGIFGHETDTGDAQGAQVGQELPYQHVDQAALESALEGLVGDIMQTPPIYSAIKVNGTRAYDLARKGVDVEMAARPVKVYSFRLMRPYAETAPEFHVRIECGGGTYVRSLVRDAARALGCAAYMRSLVRTKQGRFELSDCLPATSFTDANALKEALIRCAPLADTL